LNGDDPAWSLSDGGMVVFNLIWFQVWGEARA
jgi:hypothetical protein